MTRKEFLIRCSGLLAPAAQLRSLSQARKGGLGQASNPSLPFIDVRRYSAQGNGRSKDTSALQAAIDGAGKAGGTVYFPPGQYLSGTLCLPSHLTLHLGSGSTLLASPDDMDFDPYESLSYKSYSDPETTYFHHALLRGEDIHDLAIVGHGTIDGNRTKRGGPKPIALKRCQRISIRDVTLKNAPNYNISMLGCDDVTIDGVRILNGFADGIDPDCCHDVRIANCYIESWDDAIVPKASPSFGTIRSTENLTVTNCVLTTACNALKLGTESSGDFKNIAFSNCAIFSRRDKWGRGPISGVAIESVDGSNIDRVVVSNIVMHDAKSAVFIRLGNRGRAQKVPTPGTLQHVSISNLTATGASLASSITGLPGHPVQGVVLSDVRILSTGGGALDQVSREVPEAASAYPEADMLGQLPAFGLYCRHARDLTFENVQLQLEGSDQRPALVADDVEGLSLLSLRAAAPSGEQPVILLQNARESLLEAARAFPGTRTFLRLTGSKTGKIHAISNDLSGASRAFDLGEEVPKGALVERGNLLASPESE